MEDSLCAITMTVLESLSDHINDPFGSDAKGSTAPSKRGQATTYAGLHVHPLRVGGV